MTNEEISELFMRAHAEVIKSMFKAMHEGRPHDAKRICDTAIEVMESNLNRCLGMQRDLKKRRGDFGTFHGSVGL